MCCWYSSWAHMKFMQLCLRKWGKESVACVVNSDTKGSRNEKLWKQSRYCAVCSPPWPQGLIPCLAVIWETVPQWEREASWFFWQEHSVVLRLWGLLGIHHFDRLGVGFQIWELGGSPLRASIGNSGGGDQVPASVARARHPSHVTSQVTYHRGGSV